MKEFEELVNTFGTSYGTCPLNDPKNNSITFVKAEKYVHWLKKLRTFNNVVVLLPYNIEVDFDIGPNILYRVNDVNLVFTLYHNLVYKDFDASEVDIIHETAVIHPSAVIGVEGIKVAMHEGKKIMLKHIGRVIIEEDVNINANVVIHRASLDSTTVKKRTIIGALTNIGHNATIGKDCVLITNISIGGSTTIGNNCWIGMGAMVKNGLKVCDNVVIGMSAVVTKDITRPGVYTGNPARFLKEYKPEDKGF